MDNSVKFKYKDKQYELNYTRRSIVEMEDNGFDSDVLNNMVKFPMSTILKLYDGSFLAFHRDVDQQTRDEIFDNLFKGYAQELAATLLALYELTYSTLEETDEGNAKKWTAPTLEELAAKVRK